MLSTSHSKQIEELSDREAVRDCLYRYCRGADRGDEAALRSAYWPDAVDRHGAYQGSVAGFIKRMIAGHGDVERSIHRLSNILIDFGPEHHGAVVESYWDVIKRWRIDGVLRQLCLMGRYVDRFEKRGEEWRIAERTVVYDFVEETPVPKGTDAERFGERQPIGDKKPDDPLYRVLAG